MNKKTYKTMNILFFVLIILSFINHLDIITFNIYSETQQLDVNRLVDNFGVWLEPRWKIIVVYATLIMGYNCYRKSKIKEIFKKIDLVFLMLILPLLIDIGQIIFLTGEKLYSLEHFKRPIEHFIEGNWLFIFVYITIKIIYIIHIRQKPEKIDYRNNTYFREKMLEFSPAVLSYIYDFKIDKKDIVATILNLEIKGKIKIKDKVIVVDDSEDNLTCTEKYIFNKLKMNDILDTNIEELENIIKNECKERGMIKEQFPKFSIKWFGIILISSVFLMLIAATIGMLIPAINDIALWIALIGCLGLYALPIGLYTYSFIILLIQGYPKYKYTKQGRKIFINLTGLKKYLYDFSLIEEKNKDDLILWEEYLIYSIILGVNNKIVNEVYKKLQYNSINTIL